ncbi:MAG: glycosyl hydrolase 108 family protein [Parasphingorhabdus sp.]|nr:glycosyl hydrolase 108 family protein [Parasphingorhabdus sp.]|tara:strand:- start:350 stop:982 length:633 start_codon:yes stop_codon:yes gene_type:complete
MSDQQLISEILIEGYSQRFVDAVRDVLGIEGGHANDPLDNGGETKYGISLRYLVKAGNPDEDLDGFADFDLDMDGDIDGADIRLLTVGDAIWLYHRDFWLAYDCDSLRKPLGEALFDQAINGGGFAAKTMLQRAINALNQPDTLKIDGKIGSLTRAVLEATIARIGMDAVMEAYRDQVRFRYREIVRRNPSQKRFLNGWLNRADRLGRYR